MLVDDVEPERLKTPQDLLDIGHHGRICLVDVVQVLDSQFLQLLGLRNECSECSLHHRLAEVASTLRSHPLPVGMLPVEAQSNALQAREVL